MSQQTRATFLITSITLTFIGCFFTGFTTAAEPAVMAFTATDKINVMQILYGRSAVNETKQISIKTPTISENPAIVPIQVISSLPNVESVSLIVDNNPTPLAAVFYIEPGNNATISTRIKLTNASNVTALVMADGHLYSASKTIRITRSDCGG